MSPKTFFPSRFATSWVAEFGRAQKSKFLSLWMLLIVCVGGANVYGGGWDYRFAVPGLCEGAIYSMATYQSNTYFAGGFEVFGPLRANKLVKFDGIQYAAITNGPTTPDAFLTTLQTFQDRLFVGGYFSNVANQACGGFTSWNGTNWEFYGVESGNVNHITPSGNGLWVAGNYYLAGDTNPVTLAHWDGVQWKVIRYSNTGALYGAYEEVQAVSCASTSVIALVFYRQGSSFQDRVVSTDTNGTWKILLGFSDDSINKKVNSVVTFSNQIVVAGEFVKASIGITNVASWDGTWKAIGNGLPHQVFSLATDGQYLYAGHQFDSNVLRTAVSRWDGVQWQLLSTNYFFGDSWLKVFIDDNKNLYASANFFKSGEVPMTAMAHWTGQQWEPLFSRNYHGFSGMLHQVLAMASHQGKICVGGAFMTAGTNSANGLVCWDGYNWDKIGGSLVGDLGQYVTSLISSGDRLYIAGNFTNVGGVSVTNLAQWDGGMWSSVGSGITNKVNTMAWHATNLFVGGSCLVGNTTNRGYISRWDGINFSPFTTNFDSSVNTLASWQSNLYVGGSFTNVGTKKVSGLAVWNGSDWDSVGGSVAGRVLCLIGNESGLYVGGVFTLAGGLAITNLARWDGTNWYAVGPPLPGIIRAIALSSNYVYAAGKMTNVMGKVFGGCYRWNGTDWSLLGNGVWDNNNSAFINAILPTETEVFIGGRFTWVEGLPSVGFARWLDNPTAKIEMLPSGISEVQLTVNRDMGIHSSLEKSLDLKNWTPVSNLDESNRVITIHKVNTVEPRKFFRVGQKP